MNKRLNTVLFFLGATVVNLALVAVLFLVLLIPWLLLVGPHLSNLARFVSVLVAFVAALVGSFPLYRALILAFQKRVDVDRFFEPIVGTSLKKRR